MSMSNAARAQSSVTNQSIPESYISIYDFYRPSPPDGILDQAVAYCGVKKPKVVADIGSGTGLSTMAWRGKAVDIFGIEPNTDMRDFAESKLSPADLNVHFLKGTGDAIPLPGNTADIVTCSQSFHWMEPSSTLHEIHRVLRPGGVLVVFDSIWPPSYHPVLEMAYHQLFHRINEIASGTNGEMHIQWMKEKHYDHIAHSPLFTYTKQAFFHKTDDGTAERFAGITMSHRSIQLLLKRGFSEEQLGVTDFRNTIYSVPVLPDKMVFHYKAIYAIK